MSGGKVARYIDADIVEHRLQELIKKYESRMPDWSPSDYLTSGKDTAAKYGYIADGVEKALEAVKNTPTADVEHVRHGRWILTNDENKKRCSECGIVHLIAQYPHGKANYCPHCGTKMDESERIRAEAEEDQFAAAGIGQAFNPGERGD